VPTPAIYGLDKVLHATEFWVFGALLVRAFARRRPLVLIGVGAAAGAVDEWIQRSVPGRSASVYDWIADVTGVLVAVWVAPKIWSRAPLSRLSTPGWQRPP
jgi:VanZ family protein